MEQRRNRRLANVKTRSETGLDHVMFNLNLNTPFGKKQLKEIRPFYPGEEELLRAELDRIDTMIAFVKQNQVLSDKIQEVFMEVKDPTLTVQRSGSVTLSTVELYEVKSLLLQMRQLRKLTTGRGDRRVPQTVRCPLRHGHHGDGRDEGGRRHDFRLIDSHNPPILYVIPDR